MAVTPDKYELPIAVADTSKELAILMDTSLSSIILRERNSYSGVREGYKVRKVKIVKEVT